METSVWVVVFKLRNGDTETLSDARGVMVFNTKTEAKDEARDAQRGRDDVSYVTLAEYADAADALA